MEWTADVASGDWLCERVDEPAQHTVHTFSPRGFPAYARVFHPATRERPIDRRWPADGDTAGWEAFNADPPEVDTERVSWADTASAFGTLMHPLAQWQRLVRKTDPYGGDSPRDPAGWRYDAPRTGQLEPDVLAALARVLVAHTTTPDAGGVAVWDGWGGLTGGMGFGPTPSSLLDMGFSTSRSARYRHPPEDDTEMRHASFLAHSIGDMFNNPFRRMAWQPGILSDDISRGPRLRVAGRDFVLFHGGVSELADPAWVLDVPWRDRVAEAQGFAPTAVAPGLIWPEDHAWVVTCDVDLDSTIVAGSVELVRDILRCKKIEASTLPQDADLSWDADAVNR